MIHQNDKRIPFGRRAGIRFWQGAIALLTVVSLLLAMTGCRPEEPAVTEEPSEVNSVSEASPEPEPTPPPEDEPEVSEGLDFPESWLGITEYRTQYESGDMKLYVPRLELEAYIYTGSTNPDDYSIPDLAMGVDDKTLKEGIGLFGCSQLPDEGNNANVSLAGHRDIDGKEFYYLDTVTEGDLMYLDYKGNRYTYLYESTTIVKNDDWTLIMTKDYNCLTLTTCHPLGKTTHRMIAVGRLTDVTPLSSVDTSVMPPMSINEQQV